MKFRDTRLFGGRAFTRFRLLAIVIATLVFFVQLNNQSIASTVTLTGAELQTYPNVTFPTAPPVLVGSSLQWGSGGSPYDKMFTLPVSGITVNDTVSVTMNLTRLTVDFDPYIMLSDGNNMLGAVISDDNGGQLLSERFTDSGNSGSRDGADAIFANAGYPDVGGSFTVNVGFSFTATSTTVSGAFGTGSGQFTSTSRYLDPPMGITLVFMRDNESIEQYQLNSLTISTTPEPSVVFLSIGTFALRCVRRRRLTVRANVLGKKGLMINSG